MRVRLEIVDHKKVDWNKIGVDGYKKPDGFLTDSYIELKQYPQTRDLIKPFLQNYQYAILDLSWTGNILKIVPACDTAKLIFDRQYKNNK